MITYIIPHVTDLVISTQPELTAAYVGGIIGWALIKSLFKWIYS